MIEDVSKCPDGYAVVAKSYDQDLDADLWKDGFFGKRITRYLCLSKCSGPSGFVIDSLCIINEKDSPPNGYVLMAKTWATEQKACRKRQLCYRMSERSSVFLAITDIIILSKSKKAPEGFTLAGEMNGLVICYKSSPLPPGAETSAQSAPLPYQAHQINRPLPDLPKTSQPASLLPVPPSNRPATSPTHASAKTPVRPAPLPPTTKTAQSSNHDSHDNNNHQLIISSTTLSGFTGLEGVPFSLGPQLGQLSSATATSPGAMRTARWKTSQQLDLEYQYSFATERQALYRL